MITIIDFEDGLQEFFADRLDSDTATATIDVRGDFQFKKIKLTKKNVFILSKPFDCLQRGVMAGKYPPDDFDLLQDWSRRNWRYTTDEIYDLLNKFLTAAENKLVVHPEELDNPITIKRIEKYTGVKFDWDVTEYPTFYKENINLR